MTRVKIARRLPGAARGDHHGRVRAKLAVLAVAGLAAGTGAAWLAGSHRPFVAYQTANVPFCLIVGWSFTG